MKADNKENITDTPFQIELEAKKLQLHWLLQVTKAINYNLPSSNLFDIYSSILGEQLKVGKLLLLINKNGWQIAISSGTKQFENEHGPDEIVEEIRNIGEGDIKQSIWLNQFETIVPVSHKDKPLAYALIGDVNEEVFHSKREIITYIHTITNLIVVAIENKRLAKESIKQAAIQRELELAAQMQSLLFPSTLVTHSFLDIAATYIPHQSVGGDYYDFIPLNDDEALVCMADVSGKGLSAAMLMSNFQANLHALIKHTDFELSALINELNLCVNKSARGEKFITFFIGRISKKNQTIEYVNAGHNPPIIVKGSEIIELKKGTTGLGMFDELPFLNTAIAPFTNNSMLFCYTDGITEMENNTGNAFGSENLIGLLIKNNAIENMNLLHDTMVKHFDEFRGEIDFPDDVTFLSVRIVD